MTPEEEMKAIRIVVREMKRLAGEAFYDVELEETLTTPELEEVILGKDNWELN